MLAGPLGHAQSATDGPAKPAVRAAGATSIEDLNFRGGDAVMPPFAESVIDVNSAYRRGLASKGVALRLIQQLQYAQNTLDAPVAADEQVYVGQRQFAGDMYHLILTADLRQLGLKHAQFYGSGVWNWVSWRPAGPKVLDIWDLLVYKEFGKDRVEAKAGYVSNSLEFVGLMVGGSTASGAQGVYAVLPYELGMSYFPMATPSLNVKVNGPGRWYVKGAGQRSLDAAGGPASEARNHTGFRFAPKGDKLFTVEEAGWNRPASATVHEAWFRAGYMRNSTPYTNFRNSKKESGNDGSFVLADCQLTQPDTAAPAQGWYVGASAMRAASRFTAFDRYYEARAYDMAPFRSRPADMISVVASYTGHSKYLTDSLVAAGKTVWRDGASLTGSYTLHVRRGQIASIGLSYIRGAAITPRVDNALTFATSYTVFF